MLDNDLTPAERVLRRILKDIAARESKPDRATAPTITYWQLGVLADLDWQEMGITYPMNVPPFRGLGAALGKVSRYEVEHGRPMLSVLVVREDTGQPGSGLLDLAKNLGYKWTNDEQWVREEQDRVIEFWTDPDPARIVDAAVDRVAELVRAIRRELRADRGGRDG